MPSIQSLIKIDGISFQSNKYKSENSDFYSIDVSSKQEKIEKLIKNKKFFKGDIIGIVLTSDHKLRQNEINLIEDVNLILVYSQSKASEGFSTFIFKKENNEFVEYEISDLTTNYISSGDIYRLNEILFDSRNIDVYSLIDFKRINKPSSLNNELQSKISKENSSRYYGGGSLENYGSGCNHPCSKGDGTCVASESIGEML